MGPSATPPKDQGRLTRLSPAPYAGRRRGRQRDRRDDIGGGHSMDLKKWIARVSVVVLALVLVAPTALAQTSKEPIKIGVLNELTGPLAVNGSEVNEGIKLYWQDELANQATGRRGPPAGTCRRSSATSGSPWSPSITAPVTSTPTAS